MNPFELHGFGFLFFYLILGIAVLVGLRNWYRRSEAETGAPALKLNDPYLIAYLRGGDEEALRVTTISLADRGLLVFEGDKVKRKSKGIADAVQRPVERAVLAFFRNTADAVDVFKDRASTLACQEYRQLLIKHGLLAGPAHYAKRLGAAAAVVALLGGVAVYKVQLAFSQGRHNVGFLIALAVIFSIIAFAITRMRRTGAGDAAVADMQQLFKRLKDRASSLRAGGATNELAMLLGVFGVAAAPAAAFPFIEKLYPRPVSGDSSGSSCSSSSCGSSCGGGCGGGGCGGE